jgi:hypothetical protein
MQQRRLADSKMRSVALSQKRSGVVTAVVEQRAQRRQRLVVECDKVKRAYPWPITHLGAQELGVRAQHGINFVHVARDKRVLEALSAADFLEHAVESVPHAHPLA